MKRIALLLIMLAVLIGGAFPLSDTNAAIRSIGKCSGSAEVIKIADLYYAFHISNGGISYCSSNDSCQTWGEQTTILTEGYFIPSISVVQSGNTTVLAFMDYHNDNEAGVYVTSSNDTLTWTSPVLIDTGFDYNSVIHTGITTDTGRILIPVSSHESNNMTWNAYAMYSDDSGISWGMGQPMYLEGFIEPVFCQSGNTTVAIVRGCNNINYLATSVDGGYSWTQYIQFPYASGDAPGFIIYVDGKYICAWDYTLSKERKPLVMAYSTDLLSWSTPVLISPSLASYPMMSYTSETDSLLVWWCDETITLGLYDIYSMSYLDDGIKILEPTQPKVIITPAPALPTGGGSAPPPGYTDVSNKQTPDGMFIVDTYCFSDDRNACLLIPNRTTGKNSANWTINLIGIIKKDNGYSVFPSEMFFSSNVTLTINGIDIVTTSTRGFYGIESVAVPLPQEITQDQNDWWIGYDFRLWPYEALKAYCECNGRY